MYELIVERHFSAAHHLRDYEGECARLHGHNYRVEIGIVGEQLQPNGMLMDFAEIKAVCDQILGAMDHRYLNELAPFQQRNATSEHIARHIFEGVSQALGDANVRVSYVRVWETPGQSAVYREG